MSARRRAGAFAVAATLLAASASVGARPGGGQTFGGSRSGSGSSSRSSSSRSSSSTPSRPSTPSTPSHPSWPGSSPTGGSSGRSDGSSYGDRERLSLGQVLFETPIGWMVLAALVLWIAISVARRAGERRSPEWTTREDDEPSPVRARPIVPPRSLLEKLRRHDPNFSLVLFEDFLYGLYAAAHEARGKGSLDELAGYLSESARKNLAPTSPKEVKAIVIGAMDIEAVRGLGSSSDTVRVTAVFTSNYTEVKAEGGEQTYYAVETWQLSRKKGTASRPPEAVRTFGCPNCGAQLKELRGSKCSYCSEIVDTGAFDWRVDDVDLATRETRGPAITGNVEERGTDLPTVVDPEAHDRLNAIASDDPEMSWPGFKGRALTVFGELQKAWSSREWKGARPFTTDALFQMQLYWIEMYLAAKLRNVTESARVEKIRLARVTSDKFYDAITVRVFATGFDYTVTDDGDERLVTGSKTEERRYSEYWTFIRGRDKKGAPRTALACPNCGGPLDVNMTGSCAHCSAKVTSGAFDWVLSRIEQDDVYAG